MDHVARDEAHNWLAGFVVAAVQRRWNGHDVSHMATRKYGATPGHGSHVCDGQQGWALHIAVSRKMCSRHMDL